MEPTLIFATTVYVFCYRHRCSLLLPSFQFLLFLLDPSLSTETSSNFFATIVFVFCCHCFDFCYQLLFLIFCWIHLFAGTSELFCYIQH